MKVCLTGKNSKDIAKLIKNLGFELVASDPDVVISYGGDGTLLTSERLYPGIPKLPIRNNLVCNKCSNHQDKVMLERLLNGQLQSRQHQKLHTNIGKDLFALNDFVVRNVEPIHAIRFKILQDDIPGKLYLGDGIVVSTPFGSTGYFKSITNEILADGFAVAFNNVTEKTSPIYVEDTIGFQLVRGKATLTYDNSEEIFQISENTRLFFNLSDQVARIYQDTSLRCSDCKIIRGC